MAIQRETREGKAQTVLKLKKFRRDIAVILAMASDKNGPLGYCGTRECLVESAENIDRDLARTIKELGETW